MEINFTPLNIEKLKGSDNNLNTILLLITTLTMMVLAVLLFVLIQKKVDTVNQDVRLEPTITLPVTEKPVPTVGDFPTPLPSITLNLSPTIETTVSPTIEATVSAN